MRYRYIYITSNNVLVSVYIHSVRYLTSCFSSPWQPWRQLPNRALLRWSSQIRLMEWCRLSWTWHCSVTVPWENVKMEMDLLWTLMWAVACILSILDEWNFFNWDLWSLKEVSISTCHNCSHAEKINCWVCVFYCSNFPVWLWCILSRQCVMDVRVLCSASLVYCRS